MKLNKVFFKENGWLILGLSLFILQLIFHFLGIIIIPNETTKVAFENLKKLFNSSYQIVFLVFINIFILKKFVPKWVMYTIVVLGIIAILKNLYY